MMISDETRAFVAAHRNEDVRDLALHAGRPDGVDLTIALEQIAGWQAARTKLPDWAAHDGVWYPPHLSMEQCSSQFTATYKEGIARRLVADDPESSVSLSSTLVDLTGGFGADFSYMARAFGRAVYVERQPHLCAIAEHNMPALGLSYAQVVNADAEEYLDAMPEATLVFLDPARRDTHGARTYAIADCTPDVLGMLDRLLAKAHRVMVKLSPMLDWHKTVDDFAGHVAEVHIVSTGNECKELLLVVDRDMHAAPRVTCVNDDQILTFSPSEATDAAKSTVAATGDEGEWKYLYEPNASIMKAGCFGPLADDYGVRMIGPNSHLFVSPEPVGDFPGRSFRVEEVSTMNKRELRTMLGDLTHANIAVRNFPMPVAALRRKLRLKDGGDAYLFATTDADGRHLVIRCRKAL
ncbi:class I SAM-dependent methyltransferase [Bifidobacterium callitrichos]|uniref:class I SAM-dependent methyltransferase n=1 Tax=Bifidobacterium callitrichos TaxID=762209 RepID=UPI001269B65F|nr:class I SAM-dependent methyltransferase [Bifidobacterium callitrichos]